MSSTTRSPAEKFARQKRLVVLLAVLLILAGAVILFVLRRVPLPMRIMAGLGDVFIGCVLLVMVNQVRPPPPPAA
jgi:nitrate reductase gamma subunit